MARSNFFTDPDSWFNRGLSRIFDILLLGIITTALCIPVITIGAAITANMDIMLRIALKKDDKIVKGYFQAFGKNFLKSTLIWLIYLVVGAMVGGAAVITLGGFLTMDSTIRVIMAILSIIMVILYGESEVPPDCNFQFPAECGNARTYGRPYGSGIFLCRTDSAVRNH